MRTRGELKTEAKNILRGDSSSILASRNLWIIFAAMLTTMAVSIVGSALSEDSLIISIAVRVVAVPLLTIGTIKLVIDICNKKKADYTVIWKAFTEGRNYKAIGVYLIFLIAVSIGFFLLFVPGIFISLAFGATFIIFAENPDKGVIECFKESYELMNGHKFEFFVLSLSFIPWFMLSGFTLGIVGIYVAPYVAVTQYVYYKEIVNSKKEKSEPVAKTIKEEKAEPVADTIKEEKAEHVKEEKAEPVKEEIKEEPVKEETKEEKEEKTDEN